MTWWHLFLLCPTLTYTTANLNNLSNCLEANQCIDGNRLKHKKLHPHHNIHQTCGGRKYVYLVWMRPIDNFLTHPSTSFRINKLWSNDYDTHKSKTNKIRLQRIIWRRFYIKQRNLLKPTSLKTQPSPRLQPSTNLRGKQIRMSRLDMSHINISNTPGDKFQYEWTLIQSMRTNMSTINNSIMTTKTEKGNTLLIMNWRYNKNLYRSNCSYRNK